MPEIEPRRISEAMKNVSSWRQSERKKMIETIEDLIQESHKHAKSQYTPSVQRPRWTRLAGQLIWYKDQILKNTSLEAMEIDMQELKKKVIESIELNKRRSLVRNYPTIIVPKPHASKAENEDVSNAQNAGLEAAKQSG